MLTWLYRIYVVPIAEIAIFVEVGSQWVFGRRLGPSATAVAGFILIVTRVQSCEG